MQTEFSFWSFEISENIVKNQKFIVDLDSFSNYELRLDNTNLCNTNLCIENYSNTLCSLLHIQKDHLRGLSSRNRSMAHLFSH